MASEVESAVQSAGFDDESAQDNIPLCIPQVKVYKRRWWILFLFASLGFMQCSVWNTWGPITDSVKAAYPSWDDAEIALLSMWGTITMIIGIIPFTIMLQKKGIRTSIIITAALMALGTSIRLFSGNEISFTYLAHFGSILNGFSGIIIGAAPSLLSSTWFPPNERTTATGVGCTFNQLGNAGGFFLGPWIVKAPDHHDTDDRNAAHKQADIDLMKRRINDYLWIVAGICMGFFVLVAAYFPDRPKHPPSLTSAIPRERSLKKDVKQLMKNKNFWLLMIPYSLTIGVNVAWSSVIDINVAPFGITQDEASWLGVYVTFGGVLMAMIVSRFTDLIFGHIKITIITLLIIATGGFTWFLFIMNGCLPFSKSQLFISVIIGASFSYACSPLFFELACEITYPVSEGIIGGTLTLCWNLVAAAFLAMLQIQTKNVVWMDYVMAVQGLVAIFFMGAVSEQYNRRNNEGAAQEIIDH